MFFTLITGASGGIGEEFAKQYAKKGRSLILVARSEDKLNALACELRNLFKITVHVIAQDLSQADSAEILYRKCRELNVEVNFLINNAGIGLIGNFDSHPPIKIDEMLLLNVLTLTKLTYLFLPDLKKNRGTLLNVASQVAFEPAPYMAAYGGTKAYVLNFTEALRVELKNLVKVVVLCPGPVNTDFFARANSDASRINFRAGTTEEVVKTAIAGVDADKGIIIPGRENQLFSFVTRFLPRGFLASLVGRHMKRRII